MMAQSYDPARNTLPQESQYPTYTTHAPNNRASTRLSTYSMTPTLTPSIAPSRLSCAPSCAPSYAYSDAPSEGQSGNTTSSLTYSEKASPLAQDIRTLTSGLARLDQPKLQNQRYEVSEDKKEDMSKLALGAKLDRALGRRMVGQDASFSPKKKVRSVAIRVMGEKDVAV